jgi:parallel beta-helix repeat protein
MFVCLAACLLLPPHAEAAEGRIPLPPPEDWTQPVTISNSGSYIMTGDFRYDTGAGLTSVLYINASNVYLDMDGHSIFCYDTDLSCIEIAGSRRGIHIMNGKISGGRYGIHFVSTINWTAGVELEHLSIIGQSSTFGTGYGLYLQGYSPLSPVFGKISESVLGVDEGLASGTGIYMQNANGAIIVDNIIRGYDKGIEFSTGCLRIMVEHNALTSNNTGIAVAMIEGFVSGNMINGNAGNGIDLSGGNNVITGNSLSKNAYGTVGGVASIHVSGQGNAIQGNSIALTTGDGILLTSAAKYNTIDGNTVSRSTNCGINLLATASSAYNIVSNNKTPGSGTCAGANQYSVCGLTTASSIAAGIVDSVGGSQNRLCGNIP